MQKQQWMLHLYWIEVNRRNLLSFHSLSPPNRSVLRVWSGVQAALRRGAPSRSSGPIGFFPPNRLPLSLLRRISSGEKPSPHWSSNAQANSANPPEGITKTRWVFCGAIVPDRTLRVSFSEETGHATPAAGVTLYPRLFPPHCDAHSPPPTTGVTTAPTITTTAISPPQILPTPSQISLSGLFHSRNHLQVMLEKQNRYTRMWHIRRFEIKSFKKWQASRLTLNYSMTCWIWLF